MDKTLNLDNLLFQLNGEVTFHWREFGQAIGVSQEFLDKCLDCPPDQCIVEVLDHWLTNLYDQATWRDVVLALKKIKFHHLAESILQTYAETGKHDPKTYMYVIYTQ